MPFYEYVCNACGHRYEKMLSIDDGDRELRKACPECKKRQLTRPPVAPPVHMRYSLMHPRHMRGQKRVPKRKTK